MISRTESFQIAQALDQLHIQFSSRCRIRLSTNNAVQGAACGESVIDGTFTCPEQLGKVETCGNCMACSFISKPVRFITHARTLKSHATDTIHPKTIQTNPNVSILKSGSNSDKVGEYVFTPKWCGAKILKVTGIERRNCPETCHHWDDCYGNNMWRAHRFDLSDPSIMHRLEKELMSLPILQRGYAIRLHVAGDFPNVEYVNMWYDVLKARKDIRVFGFTAHPIDPKLFEYAVRIDREKIINLQEVK